jgi:hypothetical protein
LAARGYAAAATEFSVRKYLRAFSTVRDPATLSEVE